MFKHINVSLDKLKQQNNEKINRNSPNLNAFYI